MTWHLGCLLHQVVYLTDSRFPEGPDEHVEAKRTESSAWIETMYSCAVATTDFE